jgi:hypothetical protein
LALLGSTEGRVVDQLLAYGLDAGVATCVAGAGAGVLDIVGYIFTTDGVIGAGILIGRLPECNAVSADFFSLTISLLPGALAVGCRLMLAAAAGVAAPAAGGEEVTFPLGCTTCTTRGGATAAGDLAGEATTGFADTDEGKAGKPGGSVLLDLSAVLLGLF